MVLDMLIIKVFSSISLMSNTVVITMDHNENEYILDDIFLSDYSKISLPHNTAM